MWADTSLTKVSIVQKTGEIVDHLATGDYRMRDLVLAGAPMGKGIVQCLGHRAEVAAAADVAASGTLEAGLNLWLHPPIQVVQDRAIARQKHRLQRCGTDVDPKEQRSIHAETRWLKKITRQSCGMAPRRTARRSTMLVSAPLGAGGLYPKTAGRGDGSSGLFRARRLPGGGSM